MVLFDANTLYSIHVEVSNIASYREVTNLFFQLGKFTMTLASYRQGIMVSGKRFLLPKCKTYRKWSSFTLTAIKLLNSSNIISLKASLIHVLFFSTPIDWSGFNLQFDPIWQNSVQQATCIYFPKLCLLRSGHKIQEGPCIAYRFRQIKTRLCPICQSVICASPY